MFTYKFTLRGHDNLKLRLYYLRRQTEISVGITISAQRLKNALSDNPTAENRAISRTLKGMLGQLEILKYNLMQQGRDSVEDMESLRPMVVKAISANLSNGILVGSGVITAQEIARKPGKFIEYYQRYIDLKCKTDGTKGVYRHSLNRIRKFDKDIEYKDFEDVTVQWLTEFDDFCAKTAGVNARSIHLRNIRAVFNYAINMDITSEYPFKRFKIRQEPTRKRSLSVEDLRYIATCDVEPFIEFYRDMFILMFTLIGINTADLYAIKEITRDGRIVYDRRKTSKEYSIKVEPEAMAIIEKYRGNKNLLSIADRWTDHKNFGHQCNMALKKIGTFERKGRGGKKYYKPDFPDISTYWARHTWATIAYELDIPDAVIAQALGHASQHTTTDIYIRRSAKKVDEANRRVLDYVFGK